MGIFTTTHEIKCDQDTFWNKFFNEDWNTKVYKEGLGYTEFTILEQQTESNADILRKVRIRPNIELPGPVVKLLGTNSTFLEEGKFVKETQVWYSKKISSTLADKIRWEETIRIESLGNNNIRRIIETTLEVKIFGVGGLIESSFEKYVRQEADQSAVTYNKLLSV
ncbi:MAG: DUF2505 family protein [Nostoc sp.]|uniref:DUF2505 family protein n=1 Tax=Nostoc sp. TaxID=1180 RepID=UPI002FF6E0CA